MIPGSAGSSAGRRVRSIAVRVAVFLLLGAMANVAVAWTICRHRTRVAHVTYLAGTTIDFDAVYPLPEIAEGDWQSWGVPAPSLRVNDAASYLKASAGHYLSWDGGWIVTYPRWFVGATALPLPLRPIWPGFAINTLFYAAILWLLFAAPGRVRRWRRVRRGLCAKCAYPVGTSDVCTECGASVRRATSAHITAPGGG